jgi:P-type E1-E2 ATPase
MQSVFALEQNSTHPLAQAIINMPERSNYAVLPQVTAFESVPGQGVKGIVDSELYIAGNYDFLQKNSVNMQKFQHIKEYSGNLVLVACGNVPAGFLVIDDVLRSNAASAIAELKKMHVDPVIVSGGNRNSVKHTACLLGIDEFYAELSPEDKLAKVKARQAFGRCVAMVGDGVNDTAALAAADVNIAMGSGTDAALENAGITLLAGNIGKLVALWNLSHAVRRNIKQNLLLAFAYNIIMIPMAAGVFYNCTHWQFNPVWGSIAMSGSCLLVVGNALRLRLFNPEKTAEF